MHKIRYTEDTTINSYTCKSGSHIYIICMAMDVCRVHQERRNAVPISSCTRMKRIHLSI